MSPQKARLVIDLIRGQKAQDALQTLRFTPKRAAKHIEKVLRSAIANAERKAEDAGAPLDVDELYVAKCFVNEGARWKRLRPAPMGRAFRYQKRTAHLWVGVAEHHVAAAERVAAIEAEAEAQKGVRGTARRVRKALTGKQAAAEKGQEVGKARSSPARKPRGWKLARRAAKKRTEWDRRLTRTDFASATTSRGSRAGMPTATTPTCCTKT